MRYPWLTPGPAWLSCSHERRLWAGAGRETAGDLTVAVRVEPVAAGGPPLASGDRLPVAITVGTAPPYLAGLVGLGSGVTHEIKGSIPTG